MMELTIKGLFWRHTFKNHSYMGVDEATAWMTSLRKRV